MYCAKHREQKVKEDLILPETNHNLQKNSITTIITLTLQKRKQKLRRIIGLI